MTQQHAAHAAHLSVDRTGELTEAGWAQVRHWCHEAEREVEVVTRRWVAAVVLVDTAGLPALLVLAPMPWPVAVAGWLLGVVLMLGIAWHRHEHACTVRLRRIERRLEAIRGAATPRAAQAARRRARGVPARQMV